MCQKIIDETIIAICQNINSKGLYRFDPRDIDDKINLIRNFYIRKVFNISLQMLEMITPLGVRLMLGSEKRLYPTTFTFLIEALLCADEKLPLNYTIENLIELCLYNYYQKQGYWKFKENSSFYPDLEKKVSPSMPLYMLARCNSVLARYGKKTNDMQKIKISEESLKYVFANHNIYTYENGTESISYYYNSMECTINVNAELIDWMCQLDDIMKNADYKKHFYSILRMIINEQNEDGSWYYFSKRHMKKHSLKGIVDCHHTSTTIYNLIHVYESIYLNETEKRKLKTIINNGMLYLINAFFNENSGKAICIIGKKRKASTVQYSEALIAMGEYIRVFGEQDSCVTVKRVQRLIDKVALNIVKLVEKDGSAPGDYKIGYVNLDNINWGNGPALYALTYYKSYFITRNENNYEKK